MATTPQRAPAKPVLRLRPAAPHVSVVVINYCQWRSTDRLTRQLVDADAIDAGSADVIVVDNDSPPDPATARLRRTPGVTLQRFARNTGFARAANEGIRLTRGEWVLLLNPDTAVPEGFLDQLDGLCRSLDLDDPKIGVIGLSLVHGDGSPQASCGPQPTLLRTLAGLGLPRRIRKGRPIRGGDRVPVPWVTGCGMLIRRECWAAVGGFDESFFLYYEDTDFCRRAWAAGWSVWHEPGLQLTHFKPLHTRPVPPELRLMTRHALLTYADKYWRGWQAKALAGVVWAEAVIRQTKAVFGRTPTRLHGELRRLAGDWLTGRIVSARARIRRAAGLLANCAGRDDYAGPLDAIDAEPLKAAG